MKPSERLRAANKLMKQPWPEDDPSLPRPSDRQNWTIWIVVIGIVIGCGIAMIPTWSALLHGSN